MVSSDLHAMFGICEQISFSSPTSTTSLGHASRITDPSSLYIKIEKEGVSILRPEFPITTEISFEDLRCAFAASRRFRLIVFLVDLI